jgi:competence protein ComEC
MNIVHLFVISGFHLSLIFLLLNYLFKKISIPENYALILSLLPVFIYLYFLYFSLSASRAFLFLMFNVFNKLFNKKRFNSMQIFSFTLILMFVLFPRSIYSLSFIFSFNATFVVLYVNSLKIKNQNFF